jgi:hypothetical protein
MLLCSSLSISYQMANVNNQTCESVEIVRATARSLFIASQPASQPAGQPPCRHRGTPRLLSAPLLSLPSSRALQRVPVGSSSGRSSTTVHLIPRLCHLSCLALPPASGLGETRRDETRHPTSLRSHSHSSSSSRALSLANPFPLHLDSMRLAHL